MRANYDHNNECKKEGLDLSGKEKMYNDVALSEFVLPYFVLRGWLSFIPTCRSFYGSDQITSSAEAFYPEKCGFPLHRIGDVRGLGVTTSVAIPLPHFAPFLYRVLPTLDRSFLGLTHGLAGLLHLVSVQRDLVPE